MGGRIVAALVLAIVFGTISITACADEIPCAYTSVTLGQVATPQRAEIDPCLALGKALVEYPHCVVVAVDFTCRLNDLMKDNKRLFYDTAQRVLVLMNRTSMKVGDDTYSWRIWYDVSPADFSERLPYGRDEIATKSSPWRDAKTHLLLEYKGPREATDWP